jgi:hypothetical protein
MAKIQNPQNEKGQKLASEDYVNESLNASINKFDNTIKNIKGDAEQGLINVTTDWNKDGHYYETTIAATDNVVTKSQYQALASALTRSIDKNYEDAGVTIHTNGSLNDLQIHPEIKASEYQWRPDDKLENGYPALWQTSGDNYYRTIASIASVFYTAKNVYTTLANRIDNLNVSSDCLQQIKINDDSSDFLTISPKDSDNAQTLGLNVSNDYLDLIYDPVADGTYPEWTSSIKNKLPTAWSVAEAFTNHETFRKNSADGTSYEIHVNPDKAKAWDINTQWINKTERTWDINTSFDDGAQNTDYFKAASPINGLLKTMRIYCSPKTPAGTESYLQIEKDDNPIATSINAQEHSKGGLLEFTFDNVYLAKGEIYGFSLVNSDGEKESGCLALKPKSEVPEISNLYINTHGYENYTPRFGFTYYEHYNSHVNDNSIHITSLEKGLINSALQSDDIASEINTANDSKLVTVGLLTDYVGELNDSTFTPLNTDLIFLGSKIDKIQQEYISGDEQIKLYVDNSVEELELKINNKNIDISSHIADTDIHLSAEEKEKLNNLTNQSNECKTIIDTIFNENGAYSLSTEEKENYIIFDNWRNPIYISFANEIENGYRTFGNYGWKKFHIKEMKNLNSQYRMFHNNKFLKSFKCNMPKLTTMEDMFAECNNLEFIEGDFSAAETINNNTFSNCTKLKYVKLMLGSSDTALSLIAQLNTNCKNTKIKNKKLFLNYTKEELASEALTELLEAGWEYNKIESL